jgi:hypothetical protein
MSDYESNSRETPGPYVVSDEDTETLEWIHGTDLNGTEFNIQLSGVDIGYLLEHLFLNMFNLMFANPLVGADDVEEDQLRNWRWINLIIKSNEIFKDIAKDKFNEVCFGFQEEDNEEVIGLFDRYIVSDKVIDA